MNENVTTDDLIELSTTKGGLARGQWKATLHEIHQEVAMRVPDFARGQRRIRRDDPSRNEYEDTMKMDLKDLKTQTVLVAVAALGLGAALARFPATTALRYVRKTAKRLR